MNFSDPPNVHQQSTRPVIIPNFKTVISTTMLAKLKNFKYLENEKRNVIENNKYVVKSLIRLI